MKDPDEFLTQEVEKWLEAKSISDSEKEWVKTHHEISDRKALFPHFGHILKMGTGGFRAPIQVGCAFFNFPMIRRIGWSLHQYLLSSRDQDYPKKLVIGWDTRESSQAFAEELARLFLCQGFQVFYFERPCATPEVAFEILNRQSLLGLMLTASHNPAPDHGLKIFDASGNQILYPQDEQINQKIASIESYDEIPRFEGVLQEDDGYIPLSQVSAHLVQLERNRTFSSESVSVLYSPGGGGNLPLMKAIFEKQNFADLVVFEPHLPQGGKLALSHPNPEDPAFFNALAEKGVKEKIPFLLANDPDGDRVFLAVETESLSSDVKEAFLIQDPYWILSGNELGSLLFWHLLQSDQKPHYLFRTIVTTSLLDRLAQKASVPVKTTLTGFKWIGAEISQLMASGQLSLESPFFACEESSGFLTHGHFRDKEGFLVVLKILDFLDFCAQKKTHPLALLHELYSEYGLFLHETTSFSLDQIQGDGKTLLKFLKDLGAYPPHFLNGKKIQRVDLFEGPSLENYHRVAMVGWTLQDQSQIFLRPSGTEKKFKAYFSVIHPHPFFSGDYAQGREELKQLIAAFQDYLDHSKHF